MRRQKRAVLNDYSLSRKNPAEVRQFIITPRFGDYKMGALEIVLASVLLAVALFLIIAILLQEGKKHGISGVIAGSAETFFGKSKGKDVSNFLKKATTIAAIVFVVLVFVTYLFSGISF